MCNNIILMLSHTKIFLVTVFNVHAGENNFHSKHASLALKPGAEAGVTGGGGGDNIYLWQVCFFK